MNPAANPPHYPFQDDAFESHPYAEIFPMMSDDEIDDLASDIEANGQVTPAQVYDGKILDGRNRYQALEVLNSRLLTAGKQPIALTYGVFAKEVTPANDAKALAFVRSHNLSRRNLTTSQRAAIALQFEQHYAEIAKREIDWRKARQEREQINSKDAFVDLQKQPIHAAKEAAKQMGVGQASVSRAKAVKQASPELFNDVLEGKKTVNAAYNEIKPKIKKEPDPAPVETVEEPDSITVEVSSEEIIIRFVSNLEHLFPDEIQYCLKEVYNRRRDCVLDFVEVLKTLEPQLFI